MRGPDATLSAPAALPTVPASVKHPHQESAWTLMRTLLADRWLPAILVIGVVLRLVALWLGPHPNWLGDEREYYSAAAILADGRGFTFIDQSVWVRPPLYIVLLAALFRLFGTGLAAIFVVQTLLGLGTIALTYALGLLFYERRAVARLAALFAALYLPFAVYARLLLSETVFTFLFLLAFVALTLHARRRGTRARVGWPLVMAGGAFGAAILTRGIALPFLAAIPLWLLTVRQDGRRLPLRVVAAQSALVIAIAVALIAPWTLRNALAYGRLIPVDTTGGYNFWLGALDGKDSARLDAALLAIPNQGDRQSTAYANGWAIVRHDPAGYLAKSIKEAGDLWRINFGAYERLTRGYGLGRVPTPWLALTFVLDDLLYIIALPLAILGWTRTPHAEDRWLVGLWIGWSALTGAVFFAITRFRFPLMPFILLFAARGALALPEWWRATWRGGWRRPARWLLPIAVAGLLLALAAGSCEPAQYLIGARRAADNARLERGYALLAGRQPQAALAEFARLPADFYARPTAIATAYHLLGQDDRALATLDDQQDSLGATLARGDILRARGDTAGALEALNYREVRIASPTDQAWDHLFPTPQSRLDVGDGLDLGLVRGVNLDERDRDGTTYRWTEDHAELRLALPANSDGHVTLRLRLKNYRPAGALPPVRVSVNGRAIGTVRPTGDWQVYTLPVTLAPGTTTIVIALDTPTFVPGYADQRQFGVMLDWAEIVQRGAAR
ncbi:MAG TPA: glycosyltransferase family 39 protein [Thermomicrobiales bacterium]|nr:glycosyltransferase family 39 protein [Thermomicrobiales bacterium]